MSKTTDAQVCIGPGSEVVLHYSLSLADGTLVESSREGEPLHFVLGDGTLVYGLEHALYGLRAGDKQRLTLAPHEAFGFSDLDNVHRLPRSEFAADLPLDPGTIIGFATPSGEEVPGTIKDVIGDVVVVDFNHPLAGYEVVFDVEILEVRSAATAGRD